jgi:hypothetical protein
MMLLHLTNLWCTRLRKEPQIPILFYVLRVLCGHRATAQRTIRLDGSHHRNLDPLNLLVEQLGIALFMLCSGTHRAISNLHLQDDLLCIMIYHSDTLCIRKEEGIWLQGPDHQRSFMLFRQGGKLSRWRPGGNELAGDAMRGTGRLRMTDQQAGFAGGQGQLL